MDTMKDKKIVIKGAREHNLKNIEVEIPREKLIVITGLSGSGKSSLAFDTIYAEGQRRYVESLSAYARQFLEQMDKPDVDSIDGLSPAISIEQKSVSKNPRSTVATVTEIYDYLRVLFARVGRPHCYQCGKEISSQTIQQMVDQIMNYPSGSKLIIYSPLVKGRKGEYRKEFDQLRKEGYVRVRVDGVVRDLSEEITLDKNRKHHIDVVIDRLVIKEGIEKRLADSLATALRLAEGLVRIEVVDGEELIFSEKFACIDCGISYPEMTPRMFSFNNPYGACPSCGGLGTKMYFDPDLVVPNKELSLRAGAVLPWAKRSSAYFYHILESLSKHYHFDIYSPFKKLSRKVQEIILNGSGDEKIKFFYEEGEKRFYYEKEFEGVLNNLERRYRETDSDAVREELERYMSNRPCPGCKGARLKKESLFVKIDGRSIYEYT